MNNKDKNIDQLFREKANEYKPDERFAQMDFESLKASLPTTAPMIGIQKVKPSYWFGLNNLILCTMGIIGIASFIYYLSNKSNNKNNKEVTISAYVPIADSSDKATTEAVSKKLADTSTNITQEKNTALFKDNATKNLSSSSPKSIFAKIKLDDNNKNSFITKRFFSKLISPTQFFFINCEKDTFLNCTNGTQLAIKANTFTSFDNTIVKGIVQLEVKEAYNFTDIIGNGLHTVSNGNPLESAGMIYMNAFQNKEALDINIKKPIMVSMPSKQKVNGMQLFYLNKNANDNLFTTPSNWIANGQKQNISQEAYYEFSIRNFGWMDCGDFNVTKLPKATVEIKLQQVEDLNTIRGMLVLPKRNSIINLQYTNGGFIKRNLPAGEEAYFVAFTNMDEKVLTIIQKIIINEGILQAEKFKDIPIAEVKAKLDAIGVVN
jgi:hypothetical protein